MTGATDVAAGAAAFVVAGGVQVAGYLRFIGRASAAGALDARVLVRWTIFAAVLELLVVVFVVVTLAARLWPAPALGTLIGSTLGLQLTLLALIRLARR